MTCIEKYAFYGAGLTSVAFEDNIGWKMSDNVTLNVKESYYRDTGKTCPGGGFTAKSTTFSFAYDKNYNSFNDMYETGYILNFNMSDTVQMAMCLSQNTFKDINYTYIYDRTTNNGSVIYDVKGNGTVDFYTVDWVKNS